MDSRLEQAREWTKLAVAHETSEVARAAAEVIQSLPDQWIDAGKLRELVEKADEGFYSAGSLLRRVKELLPTPPLPTLADMGEDARHALIGKDVKVEGWNNPSMLIAVHKDEGAVLGHNWINPWPFVEVRPLPELSPADAAPDQWGESESEDQRIDAWDEIVEHPFFTECFDGEKSLLGEMIDKLDETHARGNPLASKEILDGGMYIVEYQGCKWIGAREKMINDVHMWTLAQLDERVMVTAFERDVTPISRLAPECKENA